MYNPICSTAPEQQQGSSSTIKKFIQVSDEMAGGGLSELTNKSSLASAKRPIANSCSFNGANSLQGNYIIKYPTTTKVSPPPPPPIHSSTTSNGENFYDEIDIYENDNFMRSNHHHRRLVGEPKQRHNNNCLIDTNSSCLSSQSKNSNLLQQFSSKINCFRSNQQRWNNDTHEETSQQDEQSPRKQPARIVYASPALHSRILSPSKQQHQQHHQDNESNNSSSSSSSFSRSSLNTSSMKSLKYRIKSPFRSSLQVLKGSCQPKQQQQPQQQAEPSLILSYCAANDRLNSGLVTQRSHRASSSSLNKLSQSQIVAREEPPTISRKMTSSVSASFNLNGLFSQCKNARQPDTSRSSYSLDEHDNLFLTSPYSSSSSSCSSATSYDKSFSTHYDEPSIQQGFVAIKSNEHQMKTSPFPKVNTCFVAQIKQIPNNRNSLGKIDENFSVANPTHNSTYSIIDANFVPPHVKSVVDEPLYENLQSLSINNNNNNNNNKSSRRSIQEPLLNNEKSQSLTNSRKIYSVNDVLHSYGINSSMDAPPTTIPIMIEKQSDRNSLDSLSRTKSSVASSNEISPASSASSINLGNSSYSLDTFSTFNSPIQMSSDMKNNVFSTPNSTTRIMNNFNGNNNSNISKNDNDDHDDDEDYLCDEEVEFYLFNTNRESSDYFQKRAQKQHLKPTANYYAAPSVKYYSKPIALWEQLV